jgi:hypothetical protein
MWTIGQHNHTLVMVDREYARASVIHSDPSLSLAGLLGIQISRATVRVLPHVQMTVGQGRRKQRELTIVTSAMRLTDISNWLFDRDRAGAILLVFPSRKAISTMGTLNASASPWISSPILVPY